MRKLKKWMSERLFLTIALLLIQVLLLGAFFLFVEKKILFGREILLIISLGAVLSIVNRSMNASLKLLLCTLILLFPWCGGCFYVLLGRHKKKHKRICFKTAHQPLSGIMQYVLSYGDGKLCTKTETVYFDTTADLAEVLMKECRKAQSYIYLEEFILAEGKILSELLELLEKKVNEGVQVFVMADDLGCIRTLHRDFRNRMKEAGIHLHMYNPFSKWLSIKANTRDHRKMIVIDGMTAFVGGNNLADEYFNEVKKHGHWKDTAVMMKGDAAQHCAELFRTFWKKQTGDTLLETFIKNDEVTSDGFVIPFVDDAEDDESVSLNVHLMMIYDAERFIWFQSPYLILNDQIKEALMLASKSGIDVRIIVPHLADRWFVHEMSRSYYHELLDSGIGIYEYGPGFLHSKVVLSDKMGLCGTINMDDRSYLHHHEGGVLFAQSTVLDQMKSDFIRTFEQSILINNCGRVSIFVKMFRIFMNIWKPLL